MANNILMPALSPTMNEGTLTKWLVKIGDQVKAGDILAEIETDKATMEVEAVDEGKITNILVKDGTTSVQVNSIIAILDGSSELNDSIKHDKVQSNEQLKTNNLKLEVNETKEDVELFTDFKKDLIINKNINTKASPHAKYIAKQKNINLNLMNGSGPDGRVIKRDLENINSNVGNQNTTSGAEPSSMRKIIAERTTLTKQTVPHFYLTIESNVEKMLEMRRKINRNAEAKISINDILVKALALAQKKNPITCSAWINGKIVKYNTVDVSIAVALKEGLITPIVKNADLKGLFEISNEIKSLVDKSNNGKLLPEDYNGGTISISNLGMFGISEFSAIINPPQSSILAVGAIKKIPSVVKNEIKVISVLKSTLSADHRILDGAVAGKLLKDFNDIIEDPFDLWLNSKDMEII